MDRRSNEEGERVVHEDKVYSCHGKLRVQVGYRPQGRVSVLSQLCPANTTGEVEMGEQPNVSLVAHVRKIGEIEKGGDLSDERSVEENKQDQPKTSTMEPVMIARRQMLSVAKIGKFWTSFQNLSAMVSFRLAESCQIWQLNIPDQGGQHPQRGPMAKL